MCERLGTLGVELRYATYKCSTLLSNEQLPVCRCCIVQCRWKLGPCIVVRVVGRILHLHGAKNGGEVPVAAPRVISPVVYDGSA